MNASAFTESDNVLLFNKIADLVNDEKLYLESDISLAKIGIRLGVSPQSVSAAINQYANKNFNDFINYNRIQKAKSMLLDKRNENYTIAAIAFEIGFSSLSSFNNAFKKFEKQTPSSFKKTSSK